MPPSAVAERGNPALEALDIGDRLAAAASISDFGDANDRAAAVLRADDLMLSRLNRETGELELICDGPGRSRRLADFPAMQHVLASRTPGQVIAGDPAGDPAELAAEGQAVVLMVPVVSGGQDIALLEVYRRHPQAFTAAEVDHARVVAQQFGAALDRLGL